MTSFGGRVTGSVKHMGRRGWHHILSCIWLLEIPCEVPDGECPGQFKPRLMVWDQTRQTCLSFSPLTIGPFRGMDKKRDEVDLWCLWFDADGFANDVSAEPRWQWPGLILVFILLTHRWYEYLPKLLPVNISLRIQWPSLKVPVTFETLGVLVMSQRTYDWSLVTSLERWMDGWGSWLLGDPWKGCDTCCSSCHMMWHCPSVCNVSMCFW